MSITRVGKISIKGYHHMSPEASKPEAQTQTGSDKFVEGYHPVEGVQPFKQGDLPDVHEEMLKRGVPDHSPIDPDTLEVPVDKIPLQPSEEVTETAPVKTENAPAWKKWIASLVGGAVLAGGGVAIGSALSGDDATEPRVEPAASATPTPGSAEGEGESPDNTVEEGEDPISIEDLPMLEAGGTAESVQGNFDVVISDIVNDRVEAGVPVSTGEDLQYLTSNTMDTFAKERFDQFVQDMATYVTEEKQRREANGIDSNITMSLYSTIITQEPTAEGGFIIVADDEYNAMDKDGMLSGVVVANLDRHEYTYTREVVQLPNGTEKETFVLSGFKALNKSAE